MRFGLQLSPYMPGATGNPWDCVANVAPLVDASAFDSLWLYDHFLYEGGISAHPVSEPVMECFTTLGALAALTRRVRLGQLVTGVPYRNPALVAKMATTLDLISHGRSILGLGASWHRREYEAYGWGELDAPDVRLKRLEEAIQVILALWSGRPACLQGTYYSLRNVLENPQPLQKPHPPILIGGTGEKVTLRLAAQYGQFCNVWGDPAEVRRLFGLLSDHCERLGRPCEQITRYILAYEIVGNNAAEIAVKRERLKDFIPSGTEIGLVGTPNDLIEMLGAYQQAGCQYVMVRMPDWIDLEPVQLFSDRVIPVFAGE